MEFKIPASKIWPGRPKTPMGTETFDLRLNEAAPVDASGWKAFDFIGVGKHNKNKKYRSYAASHEYAVMDIVTGHRVSPKDIKPLNHKATACGNIEHYCRKCDEWYTGSHSC